MITRQASEEVVIQGTMIPKGTALVILPVVFHRNPAIWGDDCDQFDPDRWDRLDGEAAHPSAFMTFSQGTRTCIGKVVAVMQFKLIMVEMCDEGKPTCKQCAKSKRECGGYRSEFEIVHRDQTKSTVRRMRKALETQPTPTASNIVFVHERPQLPTPRPSPPRQDQSRDNNTSPPPVLAPPVAQRAACYFASNFILMPLSGAPHGFLEFLVPLVERASPDSPLSYAFNACAYASLGNRMRADNINFADLALNEHTRALKRTHVALGNPETANTDSTLAAVLLLTMYEGITAVKSSRFLAWRSHIDGAVDIVRARGRAEMCSTKTGSHLFHAVRHQLISRTLSSGVAPPNGADWWLGGDDSDSLLLAAHRFGLKTGEFRAKISPLLAGRPQDLGRVEAVMELTQQVYALDHEIATWLVSMAPEYRFQTLCWYGGDTSAPDYSNAEVFPGRVDVYPDFVTAGAWNLARIARLILASISIRVTAWLCAPVDYKTTADYATSKTICEGTISEIIASVPYHLGWHAKRRELFDKYPELSGFACGENEPFKALPAYLLIWALTCVKNHDIATDDQRKWVKGRLKYIEEVVGIKYARILGEPSIARLYQRI
ncbi:hypothetical protein OQA88_12426 [Cercophora sp. LCS_1]